MQVKRSTWLWSPTGETPASAKRNKDVSEESAPDSSGEQPNWFLRRSSKFAVHIIMLVDIASYNVPNEILLLVEFIFREGKMCLFSTLCDRRFSLSVVYSCWICCPFYNACLLKIMYKSVIIIFSDFPQPLLFLSACEQRFVSCMHSFQRLRSCLHHLSFAYLVC